MKRLAAVCAVACVVFAVSGVQPAHADPVLVPVYGEALPDYTANHPAGYPFDPSGMVTSSFLVGTQLHGSGWEQDARLSEAPTGLTYTPASWGETLSGTTANSASIDMPNPFLQSVQTSPGWTSLARVEGTGDDWPGGSDGSDSFLMNIIVESGGGKSWQEANAHLHVRYGIDDPGWTYGHIVTLSVEFTPDVDWDGAAGNRDVRMAFGWALADVVDFYHDWGPRIDPDQVNDLLTAHYDAVDAGDGTALYYSYIYPFATPTAQSDVLTLVVDSGETFDIDAYMRGHITNNYSSPKSNGTIELTVSVVRVVPPVVPMASFVIDHAKLDFKTKPNDDKVRVQGSLEVDLVGGDNVDISEDVIVTVGPLSQTITMVEKGMKGDKWEYMRPKDGEGFIHHMTIDRKNGKFDIYMDKADLTGVINPVTISILIGDDVGSTSILMNEKEHHWDYMASKPKAAEIEPFGIVDELGVVAYPNPIREVHTATFQVMGTLAAEVEEIRVQIYDLSGHLVWEDAALGSELDWHTDSLSGDYLANGFYLYRVQVRIDGRWINQDIGTIAVLR